MARCPAHPDRTASLQIKEGKKPGVTVVGCYAGCDTRVVLAAVGLRLWNLFEDSHWKPSPEMRRVWADEERLRLLEHQHGLAMFAQAVLSGERNYWAKVERNIAVKIRALRDKLYPSETRQRENETEVQRIIAEYGFDELWECLPIDRLQARMMRGRME